MLENALEASCEHCGKQSQKQDNTISDALQFDVFVAQGEVCADQGPWAPPWLDSKISLWDV